MGAASPAACRATWDTTRAVIDDSDWSRLSRYFAGECTREEALATEAWLAQDENRARDAAPRHPT